MSLLLSPFAVPPRPQNQQKDLPSRKPVPLSPTIPVPETRGNIVNFSWRVQMDGFKNENINFNILIK